MKFTFYRNRVDWHDDGNTTDYGWNVTLYFGEQQRARWISTKGTSRLRPHISSGNDENCNRSMTLHCWPIGQLIIWWEPYWRTDADGLCDECRLNDGDYWA